MTTVLQVLASVLASAVAVGVAASWHHRRCLDRAGASFRCQIWSLAGFRPGRRRSRPGRARAVWIHDVLLVQRGRLFPRLLALSVRLPDDSMRFAAPGEATGLGRRPLVMELRLDDDTVVAVAAADRDRTLLAGPFLAAAIATLTPRRD
ncbi:MAG TPA: hypothetical protein VE547_07630 [Mycobacteriales bacterium]|nr:hypothetical protein [Mycobacteriales bacterium]